MIKKGILLAFVLAIVTLDAGLATKLPENFHLTKLDNGLEVLIIEDRTVPLVTVEIAVHNGAFTESPEYDGLSHLYEHMFFKANRDVPSQEDFMDRIAELGISFNGTTSNERVNYFITLSALKLEEGLQFMNSAIRFPLFLKEEMEKENPIVDAEFQRNESNPMFFLFQDTDKHLWGDLFSRKNTIGDHDIILSATPEQMREIQNRYYYPNNSILVVAGDINKDEVLTIVKGIYGDWQPSGFDIFKKFPIPEFQPLERDQYFITENANARVPVIVISMHGPDTRNNVEATYAADVFSFVLSQASSKLQQELVDAGLALQVSVGYQTLKHVGPIYIFLVPNPQRIQEALAKLEEHIDAWTHDDYFTDDQLENAKRMLAIDDAYSRESVSDFVHTLTYWWASADLDYYLNYVENLNAVSRNDIKKYVNDYIIGRPKVYGLLLSPEMKTMFGIERFEDIR
jgi:zinc protease